MSIKEALEKGPLKRQRTLSQNPYDLGQSEREAVLAKVKALLTEAYIPEALSELAEIIRLEFPDVELSEKRVCVDGSVHFGLEWDFRFASYGPKYECSRLEINVFPVREKIAIGREVLSREQWAKRDLVEDAIVIAYKNPAKSGGPPRHM